MTTYAAVVTAGAAGRFVMSRMTTLGAQLLCKLRALGEGAVWVAVGVVGVAGLVVSTVRRSVAALSCDLLQLVLGKVGEVGGVARSHFQVYC